MEDSTVRCGNCEYLYLDDDGNWCCEWDNDEVWLSYSCVHFNKSHELFEEE